MLLRELAIHIVTSSTRFKLAGNAGSKIPVSGGTLPDAIGSAVGLFESGGREADYIFGEVEHERPTVQVLSRSTSYVTARQNAQYVWDILATTENQLLATSTSIGAPTTLYTRVLPLQSPFDIGQDASGRALISANFLIEKAVSTA